MKQPDVTTGAEFSVYDGQHLLGTATPLRHDWRAEDAKGQLIGLFPRREQARAAILAKRERSE